MSCIEILQPMGYQSPTEMRYNAGIHVSIVFSVEFKWICDITPWKTTKKRHPFSSLNWDLSFALDPAADDYVSTMDYLEFVQSNWSSSLLPPTYFSRSMLIWEYYNTCVAYVSTKKAGNWTKVNWSTSIFNSTVFRVETMFNDSA